MAEQTPDPTPEEIAIACRTFQATWSDEERERRATFYHADADERNYASRPIVRQYEPRIIRIRDLVGALAD